MLSPVTRVLIAVCAIILVLTPATIVLAKTSHPKTVQDSHGDVQPSPGVEGLGPAELAAGDLISAEFETGSEHLAITWEFGGGTGQPGDLDGAAVQDGVSLVWGLLGELDGHRVLVQADSASQIAQVAIDDKQVCTDKVLRATVPSPGHRFLYLPYDCLPASEGELHLVALVSLAYQQTPLSTDSAPQTTVKL